jgi:drug/metabolite transporter (DMT)-like permease
MRFSSKLRVKLWVVLWASLLFWASAFAGIRAGLQHYSPFHLAVLRFFVASATLAIGAMIRGVNWPDRHDFPRLFILGLLGIAFYHTALNYGELTVTAGAASFIINIAPVFTTLLSILLLRERFHIAGWVGLSISMSGVLLIALGEGGDVSFNKGGLYILLSALCSALYSVLQKPLLRKYNAFVVTCYAIWIGTLCLCVLLPGLPQEVQRAPRSATIAVIYLGIFPAALSYFGWSYVLARMPVSRASSFLYLIPILSTIIGYAWLGEIPQRLSLLGGTMTLGGVLMVSLFEKST